MINMFKITDSSRSIRKALTAISHKPVLPAPEKNLVVSATKDASGKSNGNNKNKKEINPESIIPMDEGDFGDF